MDDVDRMEMELNLRKFVEKEKRIQVIGGIIMTISGILFIGLSLLAIQQPDIGGIILAIGSGIASIIFLRAGVIDLRTA